MLKHRNHLVYVRNVLRRLIFQSEQKVRDSIHELKQWEQFSDFKNPESHHPAVTLMQVNQQIPGFSDEQEIINQNNAMAVVEPGEDFFSSYDNICEKFEDMELHEELLEGIYAYGFEKPSFVQRKGILPFCLGYDVFMLGESGIGKRSSFCCGLLQLINFELVQCQALFLVEITRPCQTC